MDERRLVRLRDITQGSRSFDLEKALGNILSELKNADVQARFGIVLCGKDRRSYVLDPSKKDCEKLSAKQNKKKSAITRNWVLVQDSVVEDLLRGFVSPLTLLQRGELRFTGQESCFTQVLRTLGSTPQAVVRPCDEES